MRTVLVTALLLSCLTACCLARPLWHQYPAYTFQQFTMDYQKTYTSEEEKGQHQIAFEQRLAELIEFNMTPGQTYKKGIHENSDAIGAIPSRNNGYSKDLSKNSQQAFRNLKAKSSKNLLPVEQLPINVDWRNQGVVSPVKDQGRCGSCWAFASVATIESHAAIYNDGKLKTLSTQQLVSCSTNPFSCGGTGGCNGSISELAFNYVQLYGLTSEFKYSYASYHSGQTLECSFQESTMPAEVTLGGYAKLEANSYLEVMNAVATIGPLAVAVDASTWHNYQEGVFNGCNYQKNLNVNHVVVLVGYGTDDNHGDYWLIRNSWGTSFGENGYIRLAREAAVTCGIDYTPLSGQACLGQNKPTKVCGQCGVVYDAAYPINVQVIG